MKPRMKKILAFLASPPKLFAVCVILLTLPACVGAIVLSVAERESGLLAAITYVLYAVAAISLSYTVYVLVRFAPRIKQGAIAVLKKKAFTAGFIENYGFRTLMFASFSLIVNLAYAALNVFIACVSGSVWYAALGTYYLILVAMRSIVLKYRLAKRKRENASSEPSAVKRAAANEKRKEIRRYMLCGIMLVVLPLSLSVVSLLTITDGRMMHEYAGLTIYAAAAYTFFKCGMSVYNAIKAKRGDDMTVRALRGVSLADSWVSLFALQTALLISFSDEIMAARFNVFTAITGGAVCLATAALGIYMLINGGKSLKKENEEQ